MEQDRERTREVLASRRERRRKRSLQERLEDSLGITLDATEGLDHKGLENSLVVRSETIVAAMLPTGHSVGGGVGLEVEVRRGSRVDDGDVNEGEVVREVELQVRMHPGQGEVSRLQEAGQPQPVRSRGKERGDRVVASSDGEGLEKATGEEVGGVGGKESTTGARARERVMGRETEAQTRGEGKGVAVKSVTRKRGNGLEPEGCSVGSKGREPGASASIGSGVERKESHAVELSGDTTLQVRWRLDGKETKKGKERKT